MPAQLSNINVSRLWGTEELQLTPCFQAQHRAAWALCPRRGVCAGNTFGLEAFQWLAGSCRGCGPVSGAGLGCSFINQVGSVKKMKRQTSLPDTFNDHAVALFCLWAEGKTFHKEEPSLLFAWLQLKQQQQTSQRRQEQSEWLKSDVLILMFSAVRAPWGDIRYQWEMVTHLSR